MYKKTMHGSLGFSQLLSNRLQGGKALQRIGEFVIHNSLLNFSINTVIAGDLLQISTSAVINFVSFFLLKLCKRRHKRVYLCFGICHRQFLGVHHPSICLRGLFEGQETF